jgi:hypothetical protein
MALSESRSRDGRARRPLVSSVALLIPRNMAAYRATLGVAVISARREAAVRFAVPVARFPPQDARISHFSPQFAIA